MNKTAHSIYLATLTLIVIAVTIYLFYYGASYYNTSMEERFYHTDHGDLKPSGVYGQCLDTWRVRGIVYYPGLGC